MEKKILRFEDLEVWQKAHRVVLETYKITEDKSGRVLTWDKVSE